MKLDNTKLSIALARKQLTSKKLSELSGVAESLLTKIKSGKQIPRPITIGKIAKALEVDVTELIEQED